MDGKIKAIIFVVCLFFCQSLKAEQLSSRSTQVLVTYNKESSVTPPETVNLEAYLDIATRKWTASQNKEWEYTWVSDGNNTSAVSISFSSGDFDSNDELSLITSYTSNGANSGESNYGGDVNAVKVWDGVKRHKMSRLINNIGHHVIRLEHSP